MTDVLKMGKKVLTIGVVATTILWSLGVAAFVAPLIAQADTTVTLTAGDVIQGASTKNVFYYAADGKRYTFPTDKVFFSWYKDWTMVKKISDAQLGGITIGGTVAYKAGTQLVKIQTDPKVYAVEANGSLRWVETEAIAKALWGNSWGTRVHDVDPSIFPYVYSISASSVNTATYPVGSLVKMGADYYVIGAGMTKQLVTAEGLTANNLQTKFAAVATDLSAYATGTNVAANVPAWTTVVGSVVAGGTVVVATGSGVTVSLAADTPAAATVVADTADGAQALIPALKLNFTASNDGDVVVKTVKLTRGGISSDTDVPNMYLYDGETQLANTPSVASKVFTFNNSNGLFTVSRGTTKTITVKFDVVNAATAGKTISFAVAAAGDVTTGGAAVNGTFPVTSNIFTTASVTDLGKFTLTTVAPASDSSVDAGQVGYEIWRFTAASVDQDVEVRKVKFTVVGSINVGDVKNFSLWYGGTQIGSTVAELASDKTLTFDLTSAPYVVLKGVTKTLSLKADIIGGSTRTFYASIQNAGDLVAFDKGYSVFLKHAGSDTFSVIDPANDSTSGTASKYTVSSGSLSMSIATDSPTGNIASSTTNVVLTKATVKAVGEDIKISSIVVNCSDTTHTAATVKNLKVLWNGSQVGSAIATSAACDAATDNSFTLGSTVIARVGETNTLSIAADITGVTGSTAGDTLSANFEVGDANAQRLVSLSTLDTTAITGRTLTIAAGTLSVVKNVAFGNKTSTNPTGVVNATNVKVGSFTVIGGAGEDADVSQITLVDVSTTYCASSYLQNLKLMHGTTQLGATVTSPATGTTAVQTHTFNISPVVTVAAGSQYVVDVYADIKSTEQTAATGIVKFNTITASGKVTGTSANYSTAVTLQNTYISAAGNLTIAINADTPLATNMLMGAVDQTLAKFDLTAASGENLNITQLVVSGNVASGATGTIQNIRLFDETGAQIGTAVSGLNDASASSTYPYATFSSLSLNIPSNTTKTISVKADLTTFDAAGFANTAAKSIQLAMLPDYASTSGVQLPVTGTGAQSGIALDTLNTDVTLTANEGSHPLTTSANASTAQVGSATNYGGVRANEMVLYRAKLAIRWSTDTPSGSSSGSGEQTIGKFVIENLANAGSYKATVKALNFSISTTISNAAGSTRYLKVYKDTVSGTALATTAYAGGASIAANIGNTLFTDADFTDVEIAAGSSKTFYVTLDTTDAVAAKTLSVTIPSSHTSMNSGAATYGMIWSDGSTTTIVAHDNVLPLSVKSFTY